MVIGSTPLTEELYHGFVCDRYQKRYSINVKNRIQEESTHLVIKNFL
jgi:DNA adenine methylase